MASVMRWPSDFFKRLALSECQTPSPEVRPAEYAAPASQLGAAGALWTRCRHALIRNPHQVRAGRARAMRLDMSAAGSRIDTALPQ
jgi:hypothetical protein